MLKFTSNKHKAHRNKCNCNLLSMKNFNSGGEVNGDVIMHYDYGGCKLKSEKSSMQTIQKTYRHVCFLLAISKSKQ